MRKEITRWEALVPTVTLDNYRTGDWWSIALPKKRLYWRPKQSSSHFNTSQRSSLSLKHAPVHKSGLELGMRKKHTRNLFVYVLRTSFPYAFTKYLEALTTTQQTENKHWHAFQRHEHQTRMSTRWGNRFSASLDVCWLSFHDFDHDTWCVGLSFCGRDVSVYICV